MEIKGLLSIGEKIYLTCCESVQDVKIGESSLYAELDKLFNQDAEEYFNDGNKQSPVYSVRYVILDESPTVEKSFEDLSAEIVMQMLYADHVSGCYSEWTCGHGSFNYVNGKEGHSIFKELETYIGKYVHFVV
jgi:hypothetical protein